VKHLTADEIVQKKFTVTCSIATGATIVKLTINYRYNVSLISLFRLALIILIAVEILLKNLDRCESGKSFPIYLGVNFSLYVI
jgi:hypothetical protein